MSSRAHVEYELPKSFQLVRTVAAKRHYSMDHAKDGTSGDPWWVARMGWDVQVSIAWLLEEGGDNFALRDGYGEVHVIHSFALLTCFPFEPLCAVQVVDEAIPSFLVRGLVVVWLFKPYSDDIVDESSVEQEVPSVIF